MLEKYDEIRPYTDQEAVEAIQRLFRDADFIRSLSYFEDQLNIDQLVKDALDCKSIIEFQKRFSAKILYYFLNKSTTGIHFSGIENVDPHQPHLYIANHRDIVLDSSLLQTYLFQNNFPSTKSAIGDNLISGPLFVELARINNMMLVLRSSNIHNRIANVKLLSDYIQHSIVEDKESVWLAQRSGRTKNGYDQTQQGLIKMVSMAERKNPIPHLKSLNIIPVTISYEYES
ncbi:MAG TPA: 1-acyl-sn-glycerol-3-phosphate acyltransferase, partial [Bacteroidales bacterium]|nr:1-acyl-sn-glycerol-3-phosphate acyltransferase [Bacteroidales bacterium]